MRSWFRRNRDKPTPERDTPEVGSPIIPATVGGAHTTIDVLMASFLVFRGFELQGTEPTYRRSQPARFYFTNVTPEVLDEYVTADPCLPIKQFMLIHSHLRYITTPLRQLALDSYNETIKTNEVGSEPAQAEVDSGTTPVMVSDEDKRGGW